MRGDSVAPEADMDLATASTTDGTLIYSGKNDHCPQVRFTVMPIITQWLAAELTGGADG